MAEGIDRTYRNSGVDIGEYTAVALDANGRVIVAPQDGVALGIAQRPAAATDKAVAVRTAGHSRAVAGGAIAPGARVKVGAGGKVVAVGGEPGGTKVEVLGFAETAAAADGDIIEIRIAPHQITA